MLQRSMSCLFIEHAKRLALSMTSKAEHVAGGVSGWSFPALTLNRIFKMYKSIFATVAVLGFAISSAHAETELIDVEISYDRALLSSTAGMKRLHASLQSQARKACSYEFETIPSLFLKSTVDAECVNSVMEQAIEAIAASEDLNIADFADASTEVLLLSALNE